MRSITLLKQADVDLRAVFNRAQVQVSPEAFLKDDFRGLEPATLYQLNARATAALANLANSQDGRPPIREDDWAMLLYCLISSRTLREVVTRAARFYLVVEERWGRLRLGQKGLEAEIELDSQRIRRNSIAFAVDTTGVAVLHGMLSWLIGQPIPLSVITMNYEQSMRPNFDAALLPYPLELGAPRTAIRFPAEYLDYPVVRTLEDFERRYGESFIFDMHVDDRGSGVAERARRFMYAALTHDRPLPTLEELSSELGCSVHALRRNLSRSGTSYNYIKDSCRRELALDLLRRSALSIEDISTRLGFCDSDAFRRAFRGWMNTSPLRYRKNGGIPPE